MDKIEIWRLIQKLEKEFERNKIKRLACVVLGYAVFIIQVSYLTGSLRGLPLGEVIGEFLACVFLSGFFVWVNTLIFGYLFNKGESEKRTLEYYKKQLEELTKEENIGR